MLYLPDYDVFYIVINHPASFQDEELARQLVELGYRGSGEVLKREEFEARKAVAEASRLSQRTQQNLLSLSGTKTHMGKNYLAILILLIG
ncbi:hypothetical protein AB205_0103300 [Aquarana catesbeiana]|uniref:Cilia- and flagella-associated protein 299 n=1 Tax=Aquarana catesbeiana TaxID=8400 RepID=A0A2G9S6A7_AQUCT|nr:hypothetical protein AB205_0103300 [Aquarana catesbeiana]